MSKAIAQSAARPPSPHSSIAGAGLLHPLPLGAMLVMVLNDHWWKHEYGGLLTGKISDAAGMIFFPLFLQAVWECAQAAAGREWRPSRGVLIACVIASASVLAAIKLSPLAGDLYTYAWGVLQWPLRALASGFVRAFALDGGLPHAPWPPIVPVALVQDPTDVLMTPFAALALLPARERNVSHAVA